MEASYKQIQFYDYTYWHLKQIVNKNPLLDIYSNIECYTIVLLYKGLLPNGGQRPKYCRRIKWLACLEERFKDNYDRFELEINEIEKMNLLVRVNELVRMIREGNTEINIKLELNALEERVYEYDKAIELIKIKIGIRDDDDITLK